MRLLAGGMALSLLGLGGSLAGVSVVYPGRSFSLAAVMTGLSLTVISRPPGEGSP